jgi:hypothetical protein
MEHRPGISNDRQANPRLSHWPFTHLHSFSGMLSFSVKWLPVAWWLERLLPLGTITL